MFEEFATMTEDELREAKAPWPKTEEELLAFLSVMRQREHDYGTCVYAVGLSAVATYNYMGCALGTTGFQMSCADFVILGHTRHLKAGKIVDYRDMLYPQHEYRFAKTISPETWEWLKKEAFSLLKSSPHAAAHVVAHWQSIVDGKVPFGFSVKSD